MKHYVCKECKMTSDMPKNCETEGCSMKGQSMTECECTDGKHGMEDNMPMEEK